MLLLPILRSSAQNGIIELDRPFKKAEVTPVSGRSQCNITVKTLPTAIKWPRLDGVWHCPFCPLAYVVKAGGITSTLRVGQVIIFSMIIKVGSLNPTKLAAVKQLVNGHPLFAGALVKGVEVKVDEFGHPKSLTETIAGAQARAQQAFINCKYSFGIESGLIEATPAKSGYFETTACAIYDGENYHLGLAPSFEWPKQMVEFILQGYDGSQAFKRVGLTKHHKIGTAEGGIFVLTHGKINRTKLNELAITMALIHLENPDHY